MPSASRSKIMPKSDVDDGRARRLTKSRYPSKAEICRALEAAARLNLKVSKFEIGPSGLIRVFVQIDDEPPIDAFDRWTLSRARGRQAAISK